MKTEIGILALLALLASAGVQANCRAADAAKVGSDAGISRDQAAAIKVADLERMNSDTLGHCISGITSIQVMPSFPSLTEIFDAAAKKMCKIASDAIPHTPIVIPGPGVSLPHASAAPMPAASTWSAAPMSKKSESPSDFWSRIWR